MLDGCNIEGKSGSWTFSKSGKILKTTLETLDKRLAEDNVLLIQFYFVFAVYTL